MTLRNKNYTILVLLSIVVFSACKKKETKTGSSSGETVAENYYIAATIDDESKSYIDGKNNITFLLGFGLTILSSDTLCMDYRASLLVEKNDSVTGDGFVIEFDNNPCADTSKLDSVFHEIFFEGNHAYSHTNSDQSGVVVKWIDKNDEEWSSKEGEQLGSSFQVYASEEKSSSLYEEMREVRAKFSCMLYNNDVTDGDSYLFFVR